MICRVHKQIPPRKPKRAPLTMLLDYTFGGITMDGHNSLLNLANRSGTCPRGIIVGQVRIRCNADLRARVASPCLKFTLIFFISVVRIFTKNFKNKLLLIYTRRHIAWSWRMLTSNKRNILSLRGFKHV